MQENFVLNERSVSQNPAIEILKRIGYTYLSREECMALRDNSFGVLLKPILKIQLEKLNSFEYGGEKGQCGVIVPQVAECGSFEIDGAHDFDEVARRQEIGDALRP